MLQNIRTNDESGNLRTKKGMIAKEDNKERKREEKKRIHSLKVVGNNLFIGKVEHPFVFLPRANDRNISTQPQHYWSSICKLQQNISAQHIETLLPRLATLFRCAEHVGY